MTSEPTARPFQLGLRLPKEGIPALSFKSFRRADAVLAPFPAPVLPRFSRTVDYLEAFKEWDPLGNNQYGDCNAVAWANQRRLVTATLGKKENYPTLDQVVQFYKTQNPTFDPNGTSNTNGPNSEADAGMFLHQGLDELFNNGGPDGVKPVAFARVDPTNLEEVRQAISIFGSLWIGLVAFDTIFDEFAARTPFTGEGAAIGGHAVVVGGYVPNMKCVTWGDVNQFADQYWTSGNIFEAWAVIWPEHLGTRNFMTGVNLQQLGLAMKELTGDELEIPQAPFSNLYFVKTHSQASGMTEVHVADHSSSYAIASHHTTRFGPRAGDSGAFCIDDADLYLIKTRNTDTQAVEVHRATAASGYTTFDIQQPTAFRLQDANNGTWTVDGSDLYFIKTQNVASGKIEVHRVNHLNWSKLDLQEKTVLPQSEGQNGTWDIWGGDLYFIKYRNTEGSNVEVHFLEGNEKYKKTKVYRTSFNAADAENGTWEIGADGDLYFTKTKNTDSGQVEVNIATAGSGYQDVSHYASWISASNDGKGVWCIR